MRARFRLAFLTAALAIGVAGCSAPAPSGLLGVWEETSGRPGSLTLSEGGRAVIDLERPDEGPVAGTFEVDGEAVTVRIGPEPTRMTYREGRLVQEDGTVWRRRSE